MSDTQAFTPLNFHCPFCGAEPGQPCRAHRGKGAEIKHPHSRRIWSGKPRPETPRQQALCCECGQLRTVSVDYAGRYNDPNYSYGGFEDKRGWRKTTTLKCEPCGQRTRHALLLGPEQVDWTETAQRFVLGGESDSQYWDDAHRKRLRAEYFAQFPRNPELSHRYWVTAAKKAWDAGERTITALCGAPMALDFDPNKPSSNSGNGLIKPDRIDWDTEYEDAQTGLWWIDMHCVDCLAVSNRIRMSLRRERLTEWLRWLLDNPAERVPDEHVELLIAAFEATQQTKNTTS